MDIEQMKQQKEAEKTASAQTNTPPPPPHPVNAPPSNPATEQTITVFYL